MEILTPADRLPSEEYTEFAADRAPEAPAGIGAFVAATRVSGDRHDWTVAVSDGRSWAYVHAWGIGLGRWTRIDPMLVAEAVEARVPRSVPARYRLEVFRHLGPVRVTRAELAAVLRARDSR
jgi:hypothetical protein